MTEDLKALDDVPENADELVGDEVEADHDLSEELLAEGGGDDG